MLAVPSLALAFAAASPTPAEVGAQAREVVSGPGFQTELPGQAPPRPDLSDWLSGGGRGRPARERIDLPEPGLRVGPGVSAGVAGVVKVVLLVLLAIVGAVVLFWIASAVGRWVRDRRGSLDEDSGSAAEGEERRAAGAPPPDAVELLARHGRFSEAIHALLMKCLSHLADELGYRPAASTTGREVLRRAPLQDPARRPLGALVSAVELAIFGGREATEEEYQACVSHYAAFREHARADRAVPA